MNRSTGRICNIIMLSMFFTLLLTTFSCAAAKEYTFAIVPNMPALTLHKKWTPFLERLSRESGVRLKIRLYDSIERFLDASNNGEPDFIYAAPNMYYPAYEKQGYIAMVRSSAEYKGQIFVRKDSPYKSHMDLSEKTIAFVGPKNLCSVFVRQQISKGETPLKFNRSYSGSTVNVAKAVLMGQAEAGATLDINLEKDFPELMPELRIIYETQKVASHPIAAHPRVPKQLRESVEKLILNMDKDAAGKALLSQIGFSNPIKVNFKRDYAIMKEIDQSKH